MNKPRLIRRCGHFERRAFTIIELLVCIAVLAILVALLLPAVQKVRETARKSQCASNLRQIGIAIAAYESLHGMYPPGSSYGASLHVTLLPFVEQQPLYANYDFIHRDDSAVQMVNVPLYFCPSDPAPPAWPFGTTPQFATNYAGNMGTGVLKYGFNGMFRHLARQSPSPPWQDGPIRAIDVFDGLSNTAAVSEILHADGTSSRLRVNWNTPRTFPTANDYDAFTSYCAAIPPVPADFGWQGAVNVRGLPWTRGDIGHGMYNHALGPNQPSCYNGTLVQTAIISAGSAHTGGVNVLYGDGHLSFVASAVDLNTWRNLGSRIAFDPVTSPQRFPDSKKCREIEAFADEAS